MHDNVGNGPEPDRELNTDVNSMLDRMVKMGALTAPPRDCLDDAERAALAEAVRDVMSAMSSPVPAIFEMAMDKFVSLGAHSVAHGLQSMLWSGFHAMTLMSGVMPHDTKEAMVGLTVEGADAKTIRACEMVADLLKHTMSGDHGLGIGAFAQWVDEIGDDWDAYTTGIALAMGQLMELAKSRMEASPETADIMGPPEQGQQYVRVVPRDS